MPPAPKPSPFPQAPSGPLSSRLVVVGHADAERLRGSRWHGVARALPLMREVI